MSLIRGVDLAVIEEHLAVLYTITVAPDRRHRLEQVLFAGRSVANEVMKPLYEIYGPCNQDGDDYSAFDGSDVAKLEDTVIGVAEKKRDEVLFNAAFQRAAEKDWKVAR